MEEKNLIVPSNRFLQAKYTDTLTFWESFIIAKMCTLIHKNDEDFKEYKLLVKDLLNFNEVPATGMAYKVVYEATQRLLERKISIRGTDEDGRATIVDTHIIAGVERLVEPQKGDDAYFKLIFVPKLKPYLLQLKKDFTILQLADYKNLHTSTAIRIYEILSSYYGRNQKVVTVEVEELKEMLGLKGKYDRFEAFRRRILDDAQKRLLDNTDYSFTYAVKKKGRTPHSIEFSINSNKPKAIQRERQPQEVEAVEFAEVENVANVAHEKLFEELHPIVKGWGVGVSAFMKLIEGNPEEKIRAGIKTTKQAEQVGKVENLAGFFVKAVKEGYTTASEAKGKKQTEAKEKLKAEQAKEETERAKAEQAKKEKFERERQTFLSLVEAKPKLVLEIVEAMKNHTSPIRQKAGFDYQAEKSFAENWETAGRSLQIALEATAKELYPEKFI